MAEPVKVFRAVVGDETLFQCPACRRAFSSANLGSDAGRAARDCCQPRSCQACRLVPADSGHVICAACRQAAVAEARERAMSVARAVDFDAACAGDEFYEDPETGEACHIDGALALEPGTVIWLCERVRPQVELDRFLSWFTESLDLDDQWLLGDVVTDIDTLVSGIRAWNEKQTRDLRYPGSRTRYTRVPGKEEE